MEMGEQGWGWSEQFSCSTFFSVLNGIALQGNSQDPYSQHSEIGIKK